MDIYKKTTSLNTPQNCYTKDEINEKKYITLFRLQEILKEEIGNTPSILQSVLRGD